MWCIYSLSLRTARETPRRPGARCGFASTAFTLALVLSASPAAADWTSQKTAAADDLALRFLSRLDASRGALPETSLALSLGSSGELHLAKGYGDAAPGRRATGHTVYRVGSIAKQFTAAAVLDLIERGGRLRSGAPLELDLALSGIFDGVEHWPGRNAGTGRQPVTLRSLLSMTSNLPNFTRRPPAATDPWGSIGAPILLSELKKYRPWGWPGTFEYSNTSYFLLAEVIEETIAPNASRPVSHRDYVRTAIMPRAGLVETTFVGEEDATTAARPIHRRAPVFDKPDWLKGSADVASSAHDLFAWNKAFMSGRILSAESSALMVSDSARVTPDIYYGMGWFVEHRSGRDVFFHTGHVPGFTTLSMISASASGADWVSVSLLVNTDVEEGLEELAENLVRLARE